MQLLKKWLGLPEVPGLDLDDPRVTILRRGIIRRKPFLRRVYKTFYSEFAAVSRCVPEGHQVELGSGAGFLKESIPRVITSEVMLVPGIDMTFSAHELPFADASVAALYMLDVLHHVPAPRRFFAEARRCLKPGGRLVAIEPFNSAFGRLVYRNLHHEPFEPDSGWELQGDGPLSDANSAMPWAIFVRDREVFEGEFPELRIVTLKPVMPFSYLLSGGFSMRSVVPGFFYPMCQMVEALLKPLNRFLAMFFVIEIERAGQAGEVEAR